MTQPLLASILLCPFCGTGGWDTTLLLGIFFGLGAVGFLVLFIWFLTTKQFKEANKLSDAPLHAEHFFEEKKMDEKEPLPSGHGKVPLWIKLLWLIFAVWIIYFLISRLT